MNDAKFGRTRLTLTLLICLSLGFNLIIPFFDKNWSASSEPITVSDSLVKSDFLITKESDYRSFGFFNVVDPVVYSDNVLCEGNMPLIVSFDKVVDNKNFLGSYEQSKNSFSAVNYVYEILVNETYSYQMPVYKTVKDVSKNGTVTEYTVIDYYLNKTSYRWVWKNLNGLSSLSIVKDKVVVINIKGYFKAGLGFRCIDVVPSITIGNERQNLVKYAWWNTSYTYNLPVWVDYSKITTDLVNFPVAFFIDDATADKMNGGNSFRPVSGDNTTVYDYMIDTWVDGADRIVYVKVPRIESDSYTLVNLYYGNASATDLSNKVNTYSNSIYTDVYNCSETSGNLLGLKDAYDFTNSGSPTYSQVGQVGKCVYIDADSDYFWVNTNFSIFDTGGWSMWSKVTYDVDLYCHEGLVSIPNTDSGSGIQGAQVMPNGSYYVRNYNTGGSGSTVYGDSINLSDGVFHHLGFFYDKTAGYNYVYIDGVLLGQATQSGNLKSARQYTYIGAFSTVYKTGSNSVHAYVDELHFFPTVVNASWFKAEYNSGADTLLIWGTERNQTTSWTDTTSGYYTFQNTSIWTDLINGYFTFGNNPSWTNIDTGYFTFGNQTTAQNTIDTGWFTFQNTTVNWQTITSGYYTFGNSPSWTDIDTGYFTFGNQTTHSTIDDGWFTFGNTSIWQNITSGYFTFGNTSIWQNITSGYFTFGNNPSWHNIDTGYFTFGNQTTHSTIDDGWFTFGNTSIWQNITSGYFTFGNNPSWHNIDTGYFTFGNPPPSILNMTTGYFTFRNTSLWNTTDEGLFTFRNTSYTLIIVYPEDGDIVDPSTFNFMVTIDDTNGTLMNVSWEYYDGANWHYFGSNLTNAVNGTYYKLPSPWFDLYGQTYRYRATVNGSDTVTRDITFTTMTAPSTEPFTDEMFSMIMLLSCFILFFTVGYISDKRSGGFYLILAGFMFLSFTLIGISLLTETVSLLCTPFSIFIMLLGVKKAFFNDKDKQKTVQRRKQKR